jgi:hypothetical protein
MLADEEKIRYHGVHLLKAKFVAYTAVFGRNLYGNKTLGRSTH